MDASINFDGLTRKPAVHLYHLITLKRYAEEVIMFPFILTGKLIGSLRPLKQEYDLFMFFPIFGLGGAEKVNAAVMHAMSDKSIIVFFTRRSHDQTLAHLFQQTGARIIDISRYTDNKWIYFANFMMRGVCAYYINRQKRATIVFNGQCNFAYKLFPHLKKKVLKVELIHTSDKQFSMVVIPYVPFIDKRIAIMQRIKDDYLSYYKKYGIPIQYGERIQVINNAVPIPKTVEPKSKDGLLKVYYAGRGGHQKRLYLLFEIARRCLEEHIPVEFHFAGTFLSEIPENLKSKIVWHGEIYTTGEMYELHQKMDVLLLTSAFEGFPLVIMEAMSCGVAIISTAVDSIPDHIKDYKNGFLIYDTDEQKIISTGVEKIKALQQAPDLREKIAVNNHAYIAATFSEERFIREYRTVLLPK
jgi:glycosyltransferase involved in cell wall biosynthesis